MTKPSKEAVLAEIDALVVKTQQYASLDPYAGLRNSPKRDYDSTEARVLLTRLRSAVGRLAPRDSEYRRTAAREGPFGDDVIVGIQAAREALLALHADFTDGFFRTTSQLIHRDTFGDYAEMARHLLDEGFHEAAAVIVGTTLEAHLRALADQASIPREDAPGKPLKASVLNANLKKAGVYDGGQEKQITAWLAIRNAAAHGEHDKYDLQQVKVFLDGLAHFIATHPA